MSVRSLTAGRLWPLGGGVVAILLVAATWLLLISPEHKHAADLRAQTVTEQGKTAMLRSGLSELRQQNARLDAYKALLARNTAALPTQPALAEFLREIENVSNTVGVPVRVSAVGPPVAVMGDARAYLLQVSATADGTAAKLEDLLDQLQRVQPRAVLVTSVKTTASTGSDVPAHTLSMTVTLHVFVAQVAGN